MVMIQNKPAPSSLAAEAAKLAFLKAYATTGNITRACELAGVSRTNLYEKWLKEPDFEREFHICEAKYLDEYVDIVDKRAKEGWQGHPPSDLLAMFRLKKLDPAYRESSANVVVNVSAQNLLQELIQLGQTNRQATQVIDSPQVRELDAVVQQEQAPAPTDPLSLDDIPMG